MAIIGFIALLLLLIYISFFFCFAVFFGGTEFSPVGLKKNWWWVIPFSVGIGYAWMELFINSPFTIAIP